MHIRCAYRFNQVVICLDSPRRPTIEIARCAGQCRSRRYPFGRAGTTCDRHCLQLRTLATISLALPKTLICPGHIPNLCFRLQYVVVPSKKVVAHKQDLFTTGAHNSNASDMNPGKPTVVVVFCAWLYDRSNTIVRTKVACRCPHSMQLNCITFVSLPTKMQATVHPEEDDTVQCLVVKSEIGVPSRRSTGCEICSGVSNSLTACCCRLSS